MATKLKSADIVIVGLGWTGGILAKELADTGLSIVVLERGAPRDTNPDFMYPTIHDELHVGGRSWKGVITQAFCSLLEQRSRVGLNHRRVGIFALARSLEHVAALDLLPAQITGLAATRSVIN